MNYPEHEKLGDVQAESQAIGEFLDMSGYTLCEVDDKGPYSSGSYVPVFKPINEILASYFDIDLDKIEREKRHMLEGCRIINGQ